eukprot:352554-Chlamydomonas_euryale.AAC.12
MGSVLTAGRAAGKALVVSGCVPQGDRRAKELAGLSLLGESGHFGLNPFGEIDWHKWPPHLAHDAIGPRARADSHTREARARGTCPIAAHARHVPDSRTREARARFPHTRGTCPIPTHARHVPDSHTREARARFPHTRGTCPIPAHARHVPDSRTREARARFPHTRGMCDTRAAGARQIDRVVEVVEQALAHVALHTSACSTTPSRPPPSAGVTQIDRVVEVVEQALAGNTMTLLAKKPLPALDLPKVRRNRCGRCGQR